MNFLTADNPTMYSPSAAKFDRENMVLAIILIGYAIVGIEEFLEFKRSREA